MQLRALCSGLSLAAFALSSTSCGASAVEAAWWRGGAVALGAVQDALRGWTGVVSAAAEPEAEDDGGLGAIAGMLQRKGGYVDPRLRVGMTSYGVRGLFATEDIPAGTVLVYAPERAMLAAPPASGDTDTCELIKVILTELRKGNASEWWPYLRFDGSLGANLPATWTDEELSELQNLPPYGPRLYLDWYETECRPGVKYAELDDVEKQALWMQITRGADVGLFPVYDLTNHNNGALNTECHYPAGSQDGLNMVAKVPIAAGHEVTNTYGHLETSEVFRGYGFVEPYPHLWSFEDAEEKEYRVALFAPGAGPVLLHHVHGNFSLEPRTSSLLDKVNSAWDLLDATSDEDLRATLAATERLLDAQPTIIEEDHVLALGAEGNRLRAIKYRIAFKQDLVTIATLLEELVRDKSEFRWPHPERLDLAIAEQVVHGGAFDEDDE